MDKHVKAVLRIAVWTAIITVFAYFATAQLVNSTHYEIGTTTNAPLHYWNNSGTINPDLASYTSIMYSLNITNVGSTQVSGNNLALYESFDNVTFENFSGPSQTATGTFPVLLYYSLLFNYNFSTTNGYYPAINTYSNPPFYPLYFNTSITNFTQLNQMANIVPADIGEDYYGMNGLLFYNASSGSKVFFYVTPKQLGMVFPKTEFQVRFQNSTDWSADNFLFNASCPNTQINPGFPNIWMNETLNVSSNLTAMIISFSVMNSTGILLCNETSIFTGVLFNFYKTMDTVTFAGKDGHSSGSPKYPFDELYFTQFETFPLTLNTSSVISKDIRLPMFVNNANITVMYKGTFSMTYSDSNNTDSQNFDQSFCSKNCSGNNISTANVVISEGTNLGIRNALVWSLFLNDNTSTIYNVTIDFARTNTTLSFNAVEKGTVTPVLYNMSMLNTYSVGNNYSLSSVVGVQNVSVDTGVYNINVSNHGGGYFNNCTNNSYTINATTLYLFPTCQFFNSVLNVSAKNTSGVAIQNFSINLTFPNGLTETHSTTTGLVQFNVSNNNVYSLVMDAAGYAFAYANYTVNKTADNYTFSSVLTTNSINITIKNQLTEALILEPVTINFVGSTTFNTTTSTGTKFLDNINPDLYSVFFSVPSGNFSSASYTVTILNRTTQSLTALLLPVNNTVAIGVYVKTGTDNAIQGATVTVQRQYNTSYATVNTGITDITGFVVYNLEQGQSYQWILSAPGYNPRSFFLTPYYANSPYTFKLSQNESVVPVYPLDGVTYSFSPKNNSIVNGSVTFSLTTTSTKGNIIWTAVTVNGSTTNVSGQPSGTTVNVPFNTAGMEGETVYVTYSFQVDSYPSFVILMGYRVPGIGIGHTNLEHSLESWRQNLGTGWMGIFALFIIVSVVIVLTQLADNPTVGTIGGFIFLIFFAAVGWFSVTVTIFIAIVGLMMFLLSKGGF